MLLMQLCKCTKTAKKEKEKLPKSFRTLLVAVGSRKTKKIICGLHNSHYIQLSIGQCQMMSKIGSTFVICKEKYYPIYSIKPPLNTACMLPSIP